MGKKRGVKKGRDENQKEWIDELGKILESTK